MTRKMNKENKNETMMHTKRRKNERERKKCLNTTYKETLKLHLEKETDSKAKL